jgi:hypothetical protein
MNNKGEFSGGSTPGSIIAQQWFAKKKGKVIISFDKGCKYLNSSEKPHLGFFYNTTLQKVTHRFSIDDIIDDNKVEQFYEFLPPWRQELFESKPEIGKYRTWIIISSIYALNEAKSLDYFGKERALSFVYSTKGPELVYSKKMPSPDEFIDDIIFRTSRGRIEFTEDDLELIIWALLVNSKSEYVRRQRRIEGKNLRLDLLVKNSKGEFIVLELKRDTATKETLVNQLRPYMDGVKIDFNLKKLDGKIVARDASTDLLNELEKPENSNIKFLPYSFSLELGESNDYLFLTS